MRDIGAAMKFFEKTFGIKPSPVKVLIDQGVKATLLAVGQTRLELLEPLSAETTVGKFIERRGEGLHHLAFNVEDVSKGLESVKGQGVEVIDKAPREGLSGMIAFLHPRSTFGVLTELVQSVD